MSRQDLLAPPKLTTRIYSRIVAAIGVCAVFIGIILTGTGFFSITALAIKSLLIAILSGAAVWLYSKLMAAAHRAAPERMAKFHAGAGIATMVFFYGCFIVLFFRLTLFGRDARRLVNAPFMLGGMLAVLGVARRVGDSLHCPQCEYESKFDNPDDVPIRCPECGTGWLGRLKKGRRHRSPRLIAIGVAVSLTSIVVLNPIFYLGALAPHLPTPLLFTALYLEPKSFYTVWDELAKRPLAPGWARVMAERVLSRRAVDQYDTSGVHWFERMNAAGKIPPELLERFYRDAFKAELVVPRRAKAGGTFTARLRVRQASSGFGSQLGVMFAGYTRADDPRPIGRRDETLWNFVLRPGVFSRHRDVLIETLAAGGPGELRIRATYWVIHEPSFTEELKWQPDGTPATPSKALWFRRFDLEKTVRVE